MAGTGVRSDRWRGLILVLSGSVLGITAALGLARLLETVGDGTPASAAVPLTAPVPLRAVLAPLGNDWQVVGVLGPRAG